VEKIKKFNKKQLKLQNFGGKSQVVSWVWQFWDWLTSLDQIYTVQVFIK